MAESSYPQPGLKPGDGPDCGAYTANQWRGYNVAKMRSSGMIQSIAPVLPTVAQYPDVGVFYAVPNRLAVTSPGANQISIATGASLVDGTLHYSDTAHTAVAITGPGANPRIDVVVVRQNYTGIDYQSVNTPAGTLLVTANTARIAIISGAENVAPVAPALIRDTTRATYWDIPLWEYQIAVGGVITNLTDRREWVDAEMEHFWVPAVAGYNVTDSTAIELRVYAAHTYAGIALPNGKQACGLGNFVIPGNYISPLEVTAVFHHLGLGIGNVDGANRVQYTECSEFPPAFTDMNAAAVAVTVGGKIWCALPVQLGAETFGDIATVRFYRDVNIDTLADNIYLWGWYVEYLSWGRR